MPALIKDGKPHYVTPLTDVSGTSPVVLVNAKPYYRKFVIKKLMIYNADSSDHVVTLGSYNTSTSTWVEDKIAVAVSAGEFKTLSSDELPQDFVETVDTSEGVMAWAVKLDASASTAVKVKVEFELL